MERINASSVMKGSLCIFAMCVIFMMISLRKNEFSIVMDVEFAEWEEERTFSIVMNVLHVCQYLVKTLINALWKNLEVHVPYALKTSLQVELLHSQCSVDIISIQSVFKAFNKLDVHYARNQFILIVT